MHHLCSHFCVQPGTHPMRVTYTKQPFRLEGSAEQQQKQANVDMQMYEVVIRADTVAVLEVPAGAGTAPKHLNEFSAAAAADKTIMYASIDRNATDGSVGMNDADESDQTIGNFTGEERYQFR